MEDKPEPLCRFPPRERLLCCSAVLQKTLFVVLEPELGPVGEASRLLIAVLEMATPGKHIGPGRAG